MPSQNRKLIETNDEQYRGWLCSHCGQQFVNSSSDLNGLTLDQIVQHYKTMREQAFADHDCQSALQNDAFPAD
jgi:hypothetical protein